MKSKQQKMSSGTRKTIKKNRKIRRPIMPMPEQSIPFLKDLRASHKRQFESNILYLLNRIKNSNLDSEEHIDSLLFLAAASTSYLNAIGIDRPEVVKRIATRHLSWPVMFPPSRAAFNKVSSYLKSISLGSAPIVPVSALKFNKKEDVRRWWIFEALQFIRSVQERVSDSNIGFSLSKESDVHKLLALILMGKVRLPPPGFEEKCRKLPKLSNGSRDEWFGVVWEWIEWRTGGDPAGHKDLRMFGIDRALSRASLSNGVSEAEIKAGIKRGSLTFEAHVDDGISKALRQIFNVIACP